MIRILGIETSCDETSASVVSGTALAPKLESLVIMSQDVHRLFGGVVPEIASRQHLTGLIPVVDEALAQAGIQMRDITAIAVTHAPGLVGALLVGTSYAKALGLALEKPVVAVHHLEGHLFATLLEHEDAVPPFTALLVSGGHTMLLDVPEWGSYRLLGSTRDDAAGEAFDKVGKLLGLGYPGGRPVEQLAASYAGANSQLSVAPASEDSRADSLGESRTDMRKRPIRFPRPMTRSNSTPADDDYYDLSFSGLKTAVLSAVRAAESTGEIETLRAEIAHEFQTAVIDTLVEKVRRAQRQFKRNRIVIGGGVACNKALQRAMQDQFGIKRIRVYTPSPRLATDNAAMIAAAGLFRYAAGERATSLMTAHATLPLPGIMSDVS